MKEKQPLTDWDYLAETGWREMRKKLLQQIPLTPDAGLPLVIKRTPRFATAVVLLGILLINIYPAYLNDPDFLMKNQATKINAKTIRMHNVLLNRSIRPSGGNEMVLTGRTTIMNGSEIMELVEPASRKVSVNAEKYYLPGQDLVDSGLFRPVSLPDISYRQVIPEVPSSVLPSVINSTRQTGREVVTALPARKSYSLSWQLFGGIGINLSPEITRPVSFNWSDINIHPSFTAIIPLGKKISLHTGIRAFSTIHQRGASIRELSSVPNASNYTLNTTSIIKASYFDMPLVLHYVISSQWSLGGGIQLSEFYRLNIREENENYDLNNSVITTTAMQYSANTPRLTASPNESVIVKKTEARLMAEVALHTSRWLFSAGYYYGIGKNLELKNASGQDNLYRNEYLKAGIEYQLWKNHRQ